MGNLLVRGSETSLQSSDDGYGIDCSGLISAAAGLAGANWGRTKRGTDGLLDYSNPVSVADLEYGDILFKPGSHVVVVFSFNGTYDSQPVNNPRYLREGVYENAVIESSGPDHRVVRSFGNFARKYPLTSTVRRNGRLIFIPNWHTREVYR